MEHVLGHAQYLGPRAVCHTMAAVPCDYPTSRALAEKVHR